MTEQEKQFATFAVVALVIFAAAAVLSSEKGFDRVLRFLESVPPR